MNLDVAIAGVAYSPVQRRSDKPIGQLAYEACVAAVEDAGLSLTDVDGLSSYPFLAPADDPIDGIDFVGIEYLAPRLRLPHLRWSCQLTRGTIAAAVAEATNAIAAGACDIALVWRAMHNPAGKYGVVAPREAGGLNQFRAPWGFTHHLIQMALAYSQYIDRYGSTREAMARFIVRNRQNASVNENAFFFGKPLTIDDYLNSPMAVDPLCYLDCDMPVDCAGAVVVARGDIARNLRNRPAYVLSHASLGLPQGHNLFFSLDEMSAAAAELARSLKRNSGLGPQDFDHIHLYDGFSYFLYIWLEAFGFCDRGEAWRLLEDESVFGIHGRVPLNTSGGVLGMGRLHGTPHLIEATLQVQRRAGARQVNNSHLALVQTGGPHLGAAALVLSETGPGR